MDSTDGPADLQTRWTLTVELPPTGDTDFVRALLRDTLRRIDEHAYPDVDAELVELTGPIRP